MIHEALRWAVEHTLEVTHLATSTGRIDDFAADVPHALSESPEDAIFQFEVLLRALRSPELREDVRKSYDDYVAAISDSLRTVGVEGQATARLVFAALDGLTLQQLLYEEPGADGGDARRPPADARTGGGRSRRGAARCDGTSRSSAGRTSA